MCPAGSNGVSFARMDGMLKPYAKPFKRQGDPYSLRSAVLSTQQSEVATAAASGEAAVGEGDLYTQLT